MSWIEDVEVVGYRREDSLHWTEESAAFGGNKYEPLMTVAQHNRIVEQYKRDAMKERAAIKLLVAGGFVSVEKASEALGIAHGFLPSEALSAHPDHIEDKLNMAEPLRAAVPDGYALVPARMNLTPEDIAVIMFHCGGDEDATDVDERFTGGVLWVGELQDDDGSTTYGLNIACTECLEEGSTPVFEFARHSPTPENSPLEMVKHECGCRVESDDKFGSLIYTCPQHDNSVECKKAEVKL